MCSCSHKFFNCCCCCCCCYRRRRRRRRQMLTANRMAEIIVTVRLSSVNSMKISSPLLSYYMPTDGLMSTESDAYLYIILPVLRQIHSLFCSKFSRVCDTVLPLQVPVPIFFLLKKLIPNLTGTKGVK
jgi:hypothetical protein